MKYAKDQPQAGFKKDSSGGKFELRFHAGYKGEETPRSLVIGSKEFKIEKIIWRRRFLDKKSGKRFEVYKCKMENDTVKIRVYESGEWEISFSEDT